MKISAALRAREPNMTSPIHRELGAIVRLAIPLSIAQVAVIALGFIDTLTFSTFGINVLAAGGLGVAVFSFINIVAVGVLAAVGNQVAWLVGAARQSEIGAVSDAGILNAVVVGGTVFAILAVCKPVLLLLGQEPELAEGAAVYLFWAGMAVAPTLVFVSYRGVLTGLNHTVPVTWISVLGVLTKGGVNIAIATFAGPEAALAWIGFSTTATFFVMAAAAAAYTHLTFPDLGLLRSDPVARRKAAREGLSLGLPIGATYGVEAGLFTGAALIAGSIGAASLAAHHVANQFVYVTFMIAVGISHATSIRIGQAAGAEDHIRVRVVAKTGLGLGFGAMTLMALVFAVFGSALVGLIVTPQTPEDAEVARLAAGLLIIAACFQWSDGLQNIAMGALRGLKHAKTTLIGGVLGYWGIGLTTALLGAAVFEERLYGVWLGLATGLTATAMFLIWRLHRLTRPIPAVGSRQTIGAKENIGVIS
jgi:MATE family multidrug resistance protein